MKTETLTMHTTAIFSEDMSRCYLLRKEWDDTKPSITVIILRPSSTGLISIDSTTSHIMRNCEELGYGSVNICNIFSGYDSRLTCFLQQQIPHFCKTFSQSPGWGFLNHCSLNFDC